MYDTIGWIMMSLSIVAAVLSSKFQNKWAMAIYMVTSAWWFFYNVFIISEYHQGYLRLFYFIFGVVGFYTWGKKQSEKDELKLEVIRLKKIINGGVDEQFK